jgi:predicted regulator of amino acid metabolism with ACT domain
MVRKIEIKVNKINKECETLLNRVNEHIKLFETIEKDQELKDDTIFRREHERLEDEISKFVKEFRENRKEVFKITEYVVDSEQLVSILE